MFRTIFSNVKAIIRESLVHGADESAGAVGYFNRRSIGKSAGVGVPSGGAGAGPGTGTGAGIVVGAVNEPPVGNGIFVPGPLVSLIGSPSSENWTVEISFG